MAYLTNLRQIIQNNTLDAALISSKSNITYLTEYAGFSPRERDAYVLVTLDHAYIFTNLLYADEVRQQTKDFQIKIRTSQDPFIKQLQEIIKKEKLSSIGIEDTNLTVAEYEELSANTKVTFYPLDLNRFRIKKNHIEIENIKKACVIGNKALTEITPQIKPAMTEEDVALLLEIVIRKQGAQLSFPTIVAFGKNSAVPHHHTDSTKLKENDVILIDFGVLYNSYCSDMTRTFSVGKPANDFNKIYSVTSAAQKKAESFISEKLAAKEKIRGRDVDAVAREYITAHTYPSIPHSLGHGIGIEVHEAPSLSIFSKDTLEEGMVFSIEPGIYLTDSFGVRIEDLYTISNNKILPLTYS